MLADIVERADARVLERGNRTRFALEPLFELRIGSAMLGQNLDGDDAIQAGVASAVHFSHPAHSNARDDFVSAETDAGRQRHVRGTRGLYISATLSIDELRRLRSSPFSV